MLLRYIFFFSLLLLTTLGISPSAGFSGFMPTAPNIVYGSAGKTIASNTAKVVAELGKSSDKVAKGVTRGENGVPNATNRIVHNLDDFSDAEVGIITEADGILSSSQMNTIRQAYENGESATVVINGRTIQYEPDLLASGMTMFGEDGFLIGREAFANPGELDRTVLHELHRLTTSQSASGLSGSLATSETQVASDFANRAYEAMNP